MRLLAIAAAGFNLARLAGDAHHSSGWENGRRIGRGSLSKTSASLAFSQIENCKPSLIGLVGGQVESAEARGASRGASADSGVSMELADMIKRDSQQTSSGAVFAGTSVPIKLLFEFLEDDQTVDTFLDQFPTVTRDQACAVLGASRDMLLSAARSET